MKMLQREMKFEEKDKRSDNETEIWPGLLQTGDLGYSGRERGI
jgi:hypothetical protein